MRSVSQIYSEAVSVRNNYLQFTELNTGRSNSKLSMINLLTYVVAVCIHTYEAVLDLFQVKIANVLNGRINGTPDWYALMAKKFQYNSVTATGDELVFNENTLKIEYSKPDVSRRIIEKVAWERDENDGSLTLKVCKANTNSEEIDNGVPYMPLGDYELIAFKMYMQQIRFVGADIYCESCPGDILTIVADKNNPIFFNDSYITAAQAISSIKQGMIDFANAMEYDGYLYYQAILDVIRKTEHITDVGSNIKIYISQYNTVDRAYDEPVRLNGRTKLKSGYIRLLDVNSVNVINSDNLTLIPASQMDEYNNSMSPDGCGCDCGCEHCQ